MGGSGRAAHRRRTVRSGRVACNRPRQESCGRRHVRSRHRLDERQLGRLDGRTRSRPEHRDAARADGPAGSAPRRGDPAAVASSSGGRRCGRRGRLRGRIGTLARSRSLSRPLLLARLHRERLRTLCGRRPPTDAHERHPCSRHRLWARDCPPLRPRARDAGSHATCDRVGARAGAAPRSHARNVGPRAADRAGGGSRAPALHGALRSAWHHSHSLCGWTCRSRAATAPHASRNRTPCRRSGQGDFRRPCLGTRPSTRRA